MRRLHKKLPTAVPIIQTGSYTNWKLDFSREQAQNYQQRRIIIYYIRMYAIGVYLYTAFSLNRVVLAFTRPAL